jgi:hypothetical protein
MPALDQDTRRLGCLGMRTDKSQWRTARALKRCKDGPCRGASFKSTDVGHANVLDRGGGATEVVRNV